MLVTRFRAAVVAALTSLVAVAGLAAPAAADTTPIPDGTLVETGYNYAARPAYTAGADDWTCRPQAGKNPVVLLPGTFANAGANFTKLGFHPGFGLTLTLPRLLGEQRAALLCLSSRRIDGEQAAAWGLADFCVPQAELRATAHALAAEIAGCAPLAVMSTRATLRVGLADRIARQTDHELVEQNWLRTTSDWVEGIKATAERREPVFTGS